MAVLGSVAETQLWTSTEAELDIILENHSSTFSPLEIWDMLFVLAGDHLNLPTLVHCCPPTLTGPGRGLKGDSRGSAMVSAGSRVC